MPRLIFCAAICLKTIAFFSHSELEGAMQNMARRPGGYLVVGSFEHPKPTEIQDPGRGIDLCFDFL